MPDAHTGKARCRGHHPPSRRRGVEVCWRRLARARSRSRREFILHLPQRWANTAHRQSHVPAPARAAGATERRRSKTSERTPQSHKSAVSTAPSSPILTTSGCHSPCRHPGASTGRAALRPTAGSATAAAQRVLTLATESLDMMRSVTGIFKESLDRAETYVFSSYRRGRKHA